MCSCDPGPSLDSDEGVWGSEVGGEGAPRLTSFLSTAGQVSDAWTLYQVTDCLRVDASLCGLTDLY